MSVLSVTLPLCVSRKPTQSTLYSLYIYPPNNLLREPCFTYSPTLRPYSPPSITCQYVSVVSGIGYTTRPDLDPTRALLQGLSLFLRSQILGTRRWLDNDLYPNRDTHSILELTISWQTDSRSELLPVDPSVIVGYKGRLPSLSRQSIPQ